MDPYKTAVKAHDQINQSFEEREVARKAESLGVGYIDISKFPLNPDVLKTVDRDEASQAKLMPFQKAGKKLKIAVVDPEQKKAKSLINKLESDWEVFLFLCSPTSFEKAHQLYESKFLNLKQIQNQKHFEEQSKNIEARTEDLEVLQKEISNLPAKTALNKIEILALQLRASDIHIQPAEKEVILRFRIDGVLHDILRMDLETAQALVLRIKYEAGMKSNITHKPQDGHAILEANGRKVDLRIGTLPTPTIESVVIRILDSFKGIRAFSELGFTEDLQAKLNQALHLHNGLILVTGPTGSGKTTTLYSMLSELNNPEKKIVTLEDPIEYHLAGISQSQVDTNEDYTFETGFKSLLRHDPDIMLVGEIRTLPTAKLAAEAALTGHTVLSSLHTNSAAGAITRLRNMGMENFNIAPTLAAVFAQRLIRKSCPHCSAQEEKGCDECAHTGYQGQTVVAEGFIVTEKIRKMILDGVSQDEIEKVLRETQDFKTLKENGLQKAEEGITTEEEVLRITN